MAQPEKPTETGPAYASAVITSTAKNEGEMLQLELYVSDLDTACRVFGQVFGLDVIEDKPGWRHLRHPQNFDIMLFAPQQNSVENSHWSLPAPGTGGKGIEIVICTTDIAAKLEAVRELGLQCTDLKYPAWGGVEFIFYLDEGYLVRAKQVSQR